MAANDWPPLIRAVDAKNIVECRRLIDTGEANVNGDRTHYGSTALHIASYYGHLEISELLTSSGADVNIRNTYGWTALHEASADGHLEIAELLTSSGADVNIRTSVGRTALHYASLHGHLEIAQLLLCQGADMSIRTNDGRTALDIASSYGRLKVDDCLRKWPLIMAIIELKEDLAVYHLLDAWTIIDLWQYLGNQ